MIVGMNSDNDNDNDNYDNNNNNDNDNNNNNNDNDYNAKEIVHQMETRKKNPSPRWDLNPRPSVI